MAITNLEFEERIKKTTKEEASVFLNRYHADYINKILLKNNISLTPSIEKTDNGYHISYQDKKGDTVGYLEYRITLTEKIYFWIIGKCIKL